MVNLVSGYTGTPNFYPDVDVTVETDITVNSGSAVEFAGTTASGITSYPNPDYAEGAYVTIASGATERVKMPIRNSQINVRSAAAAYDFDFVPINFTDLGLQKGFDT